MFKKHKVTSFTMSRPNKKQRGVTAIEYAIIGVSISAIVLAVLTTDNPLQGALSGAMSAISSNVEAGVQAAKK